MGQLSTSPLNMSKKEEEAQALGLLEHLQMLFRQAPQGLSLDDLMQLLEPPHCEHGLVASECRKRCEDVGRRAA